MKKILATMIMAGAMAAPSLWAIPDNGQVNVLGNSHDGYFLVAPDNSFAFQSFCLEWAEDIGTNPHWYQVNPDGEALLGGPNSGSAGPNGGDPISLGTAYLYKQFRSGTLTGFDPSLTGVLQSAIWWLEDEIYLYNPVANPFLALLETELNLASLDAAKDDANGAYGVKVLNLYNGNPQDQRVVNRQDFLVVPDGGFTLAFLGMGLTGLAWLNRRIRA